MPKLAGKHGLLKMLRAEGVEFIFGNPGTSEAPIMDIMGEYPELKYVLVVQEGVAIGMAEGYARATGNVAFVSLHIDNGMANSLSLLIDSKYAGTPMVVTAGNKDVRKMAEGRSDLAEMARPFTKWSAEVTHPEQFPSMIRRAFNEARTPPTGPVFLAFSANSMDDEAEMDIIPSSRHFTSPLPDHAAIEMAAELVANAETPMLIVGDRVGEHGGVDAAVKLAERTGARVYGHGSAAVNFPTSHPQWLGGLNVRTAEAVAAIRSADVIVAAGAPVFDDFFYQPGQFVAPDSKLIHIDINPGAIGKSEPTDVGILASPKAGLEHLGHAVSNKMTGTQVESARGRIETIAAESRAQAQQFEEAAQKAWNAHPMGPAAMAKALADSLPRDAVIVNDAVSTSGQINSAVRHDGPGTYFGARGGAIGWGMGLGMGVKLANPERPVVTVVGDGSAMMTVQALWTAVNSDIPVVYLICNNASYRVLKVNMNHYRRLTNQPLPEKYFAMDFPTPFDFAAIARGFGVHGVRIENPDDLGPELQKAIRSGKPTVLDVVIDGAV